MVDTGNPGLKEEVLAVGLYICNLSSVMLSKCNKIKLGHRYEKTTHFIKLLLIIGSVIKLVQMS